MTDGGLDYTFECIGNVKTMVRPLTVSCHRLWQVKTKHELSTSFSDPPTSIFLPAYLLIMRSMVNMSCDLGQ